MATITINEKEYELESLSDETKARLGSLQFVDAELQRLNAQIAVFHTARRAYSEAISASLPK